MKKALIIGAGYVGTALAKHWKSKFNVECTTTKKERLPEIAPFCDAVRILQGNDLSTVQEAIADKDIIVICVAPKHSLGDKMDYRSTYLETALTMQEALHQLKKEPHVIYTSSTGVYSKEGAELLSETSLKYSENPNHQFLKAAEDAYLELSPQLPVTIFRLSQIIGPNPRDFKSSVSRMSGKVFPTSGLEYPNVIHVDDIVKAITYAIDNRLIGIYNLSQQLKISRKQIYSHLCQKLNLAPVQFATTTTTSSQILSDKILETGFAFDDIYNDLMCI